MSAPQKRVYCPIKAEFLPASVWAEFLARFQSQAHKWDRGFEVYSWADPVEDGKPLQFARSWLDQWFVGVMRDRRHAD